MGQRVYRQRGDRQRLEVRSVGASMGKAWEGRTVTVRGAPPRKAHPRPALDHPALKKRRPRQRTLGTFRLTPSSLQETQMERKGTGKSMVHCSACLMPFLNSLGA